MERQHSATAAAEDLESREPTCSPGPVTHLSPCLFELQALCMRFWDLRVSPGARDSDVQVLHSVGVWKQGVLPEFPRSGREGVRDWQVGCGNRPFTVTRELGSHQMPLCLFSCYLFAG